MRKQKLLVASLAGLMTVSLVAAPAIASEKAAAKSEKATATKQEVKVADAKGVSADAKKKDYKNRLELYRQCLPYIGE